MSRLRANQITNENANGAPNFPHGLTVTGVVTATTAPQTMSSIVVGSAVTANSTGIDVTGIITATSFSGIDSDKISEGNTEVETVDTGSDGHIKFTTEGSDRGRFDNGGRLLVGHTAAHSVGGGNSKIQVQATDSTGRISVVQHRNEASGSPFITLGKSRGTSVGAVTILQDGDEIGTFNWAGADGNDLDNQACCITGAVDGTPGSNDMPGRLMFKTSSDGAASSTERLRINSVGNMSLGGLDPVPTSTSYNTASFHIHQTTNATNVGAQIHLTTANKGSAAGDGSQVSQYNGSLYINNQDDGDTYFYNNGSATATIKANGNFGIATQSPTDKLHVNGTALISSNLYLNNNVYLASSKGLYFDGSTSSANFLNDYEEGTWTPVIQGTGSNNSKNYTNQIASYTKIGNMVYLSFRVSWDSRTSDTGDAIVSGFPFTVNDASNATGSLAGNNLNFNNLSDCITAAMEFSNNQQYAFILMTQDSGTWVNPSANPFWQSTGEIRGSITYRTDS